MTFVIGANLCRGQLTSSELAAANDGQLALVPAVEVPRIGAFFSWQRDWQAALPFDAFPDFPDLDVYSLGSGRFIVDDRASSYELSSAGPSTSTSEEDTSSGATGASYGCGLWLDISATGSNAVLVTIHNKQVGQAVSLWSSTNLALAVTDWALETNVTGASGDFTPVLIAMGARSNLFFTVVRDYVMATNFMGLGAADAQVEGALINPDSMGAVGSTHFCELLNGQNTNGSIAMYRKSDYSLAVQTNTLDFFSLTNDGTHYPIGYPGGKLVDPRILYDHQSQRWVACALDFNSNSRQVLLAVSTNDSPTNFITDWHRYFVDVRRADINTDTDFPTLGVDANGIYVAILQRQSDTNSGALTNAGHTVVAIKKPEIYQGTFIPTKLEIYTANTAPVWTVQPAVNFDNVGSNGYAWLVAKGAPDLGTNYQGGPILYRRIQWTGTNAAWADTSWSAIDSMSVAYRDYYDLDGTNIVFIQGHGVSSPQQGSTNGIALGDIGSRLAMSSIRDGFLWTCQAIGLNGTNGVYNGNQTGTNVDRSGVQWFKLRVDDAGGSLSYSAHGRIYDNTNSTNQLYYSFPSLAINCAGDMVMGYSGSSATSYVGAYYSWRPANGSILSAPRLIRPGTVPFPSGRWGDYSATTSDPTNPWEFWTVQEYAHPSGLPDGVGFSWRTVIGNIRADH